MKRKLFILAVLISGCSSNLTSPGSGPSYGPGEFGYIVNGDTVVRFDTTSGASASVTIGSNQWLRGYYSVRVTLNYPGHLRGYEMDGVAIEINEMQLKEGTFE